MSYILKINFTDNTPQFVRDYYRNYTSHHDGDAGIDLMTPVEKACSSFNTETINFEIRCEMVDRENKNVSYFLYPRSSISKTPLMMANSVGIIDAGYRGNIMAKVRNMEPDTLYRILTHEKLFQICAPDLKPVRVEIVESLSETSRGEGGFGSTNK